ncbi:hypothetical protein BS50DRAFT_67242 [Corynespora cassiicola Philippines]|uniref:Transmembrane protein n=1 Tax=Corynespora cassiicola Philippines TaxID=1448308 RepID=A0A2T2NFN4_CORCC|nr:hypothetical protein BS50DRAFT_67242 [Corynespora cassiicola Philippines]
MPAGGPSSMQMSSFGFFSSSGRFCHAYRPPFITTFVICFGAFFVCFFFPALVLKISPSLVWSSYIPYYPMSSSLSIKGPSDRNHCDAAPMPLEVVSRPELRLALVVFIRVCAPPT